MRSFPCRGESLRQSLVVTNNPHRLALFLGRWGNGEWGVFLVGASRYDNLLQ